MGSVHKKPGRETADHECREPEGALGDFGRVLGHAGTVLAEALAASQLLDAAGACSCQWGLLACAFARIQFGERMSPSSVTIQG